MAISRCKCFSHRDEWPEGYNPNGYGACKFPEITYEGAVLATWERNGYNDSDFYAAVWDEETQAVRSVEYASTRGWTYHNSAVVDATDEVKFKGAKWYADRVYERSVRKAEAEAVNPTVGKTVHSTTTRGKNKDAIGTVVARRANPYRTYYKNGYNRPESEHNQQVLVQVWGEWINDKEADMSFILEYETGDERLRMAWMEVTNVEVIDAEPVDYDELRAHADTFANNSDSASYISAFDVSWVM